MFNKLFVDFLKNNNLVDNKIDELAPLYNKEDSFICDILLANNIFKEKELCYILANYIGIEYRDISLTEIDLELVKRFPREKLILNRSIPYKETEDSIYVIISNPLSIIEIDDLKNYLNKKMIFQLVVDSKMEEFLSFINNKAKQTSILASFSEQDYINEDSLDEIAENDAPIIALCDSILVDAVSRNASDIHIEPYEDEIRVRYRIDGQLETMNSVKPNLYPHLLARFKIMSELNIAERRVPQDGKISNEINGNRYDFRVSTMPTIFGEKIVIRIFNKTLSSSNMSLLGFSEDQRRLITSIITRPHGIVLLTGPTGSGKSTTLYTFLRYLNKGDINIVTAEDPVENEIKGITQVQVNPKANLTFSSILRATLRQDPNIIMIGEIRDEETAHIAVRAAITGHLVFSTIHTNSAAAVVSRLVDMGIAPYLVADSLICSMSQRLIRKLCPHCKKEHITTDEEMRLLGLAQPKKIFEPCGCSICSNTGYQGRVGIFEILPVDSKVRNVIMNRNFTSEMLEMKVRETISPIRNEARLKVLSGETSIKEFTSLLSEYKDLQ